MNQRRYWVHPENMVRGSEGAHIKLDRMYNCYPDRFKRALRVTPEQFDELLLLLEHNLQTKTARRGCIPPKIRLYVTLKYSAHGTSMQQLAESFCLGTSTVSTIVNETTRVIWNVLSEQYIPTPTKAHWEDIAQNFSTKWNFPNCIGALDGKHINIQRPNNSGSLYFNYKKTFSLNLMATCDADYRFTMIDVGGYGRNNDSGIFRSCPMGKKLLSGKLNLPEPKQLLSSFLEFPFVFVADDAFPMMEFIMKPFPGKSLQSECRIFNYRLSRARRTIENAFGILAARFRIFRAPIIGKPENIDFIVKAACVLHNFLRTWDLHNTTNHYFGPSEVDHDSPGDNEIILGSWRRKSSCAFSPVKRRLGSNNFCHKVRMLRNNMANYFVTLNLLPWQQKYVQTASWNPVSNIQ